MPFGWKLSRDFRFARSYLPRMLTRSPPVRVHIRSSEQTVTQNLSSERRKRRSRAALLGASDPSRRSRSTRSEEISAILDFNDGRSSLPITSRNVYFASHRVYSFSVIILFTYSALVHARLPVKPITNGN
jgi:hypothetical protein